MQDADVSGGAPGLLFRLSGECGARADFSRGDGEPSFLKDVEVIQGGADGAQAFSCGRDQLFAFKAPGNIYAQRGTLSLFWRSRYPVGPTEFPIFRVGYADHSSWDAVWLRMDYNGGGFDAFVTDANLSRIRVSCAVAPFPPPERWIHLAFSWDENRGVRLYVDGQLAAKKDAAAVLDTGLDQFGTHSRIISHWSVQSAFNYIRGGDVDEVRIYDRMLSDENVASLSRSLEPRSLPPADRDISRAPWRNEWLRRYGFDSPELPPLLGERASVRKVEIHEAYDHKRWWWKGCDGIRETTWPGVYNRSRLPGRSDYFILPDWDCYSVSGREIVFRLPDEVCNYLEISGSAHGRFYDAESGAVLGQRRAGFDRSFHRLGADLRGASIRFVNDEAEEPIADFSAFYLGADSAPASGKVKAFSLTHQSPEEAVSRCAAALDYIGGRYMADERAVLYGVPPSQTGASSPSPLPILHLLLPYDDGAPLGLDGVELVFPPHLTLGKREDEALFNIQIKDPLWLPRNLANFSFRLSGDRPSALWIDTRDRVLPEGGVLYLTLAASGAFNPAALPHLSVRLHLKDAEDAATEHVADRFIQVRDNYSHLVEEYPRSKKYSLYRRFMADLGDLLRVAPHHRLGLLYRYDFLKGEKPHFEQTAVPTGVPPWAFRQVEYLGYIKRVLTWWIDQRQIANGEFGGGLSDDGDLTALWPGPALMGCMPDKIKASLLREMEAFFENGMFTAGLSTIQTDQLHVFEEGTTALGQCLVLDEGNPLHLERAMETSRAAMALTAVNSRGHRHFFSAYFSGTKRAREYPWNFSNPDSYHILHPAYMLVRYSGNPSLRALVLELADSLLAHYRDGKMHCVIDFDSDEDEFTEKDREWPLLVAACEFSGNAAYLEPLKAQYSARPRNLGAVDKEEVAAAYESLIETAALREYINTEGQLWVDRVILDIGRVQVDRLGGVAHQRFACFPRHFVSWRFEEPFNDESLALLIPYASKERLRIIAFNLEKREVEATLFGADLAEGRWSMRQGFDDDGDDQMEGVDQVGEIPFGRGIPLSLRFPARRTTIIELELTEPALPFAERPDLGIGEGDLEVQDGVLRVKVHSLGGAPSPEAQLVLFDATGAILASSIIPPLPAPVDLYPKIATVELAFGEASLRGAFVEIDPEGKIQQSCRSNKRRAVPPS